MGNHGRRALVPCLKFHVSYRRWHSTFATLASYACTEDKELLRQGLSFTDQTDSEAIGRGRQGSARAARASLERCVCEGPDKEVGKGAKEAEAQLEYQRQRHKHKK